MSQGVSERPKLHTHKKKKREEELAVVLAYNML